MLLTPRYDGPAVLRFTQPLDDPTVPFLRQRRRLADLLAGLDAEQWAAASRCEGWTVQDVVSHLVGTDQFWTVSALAALDGNPTQYLKGFDPVTTPAAMVGGMQELSSDEVLRRFVEASNGFAEAIEGVEGEQWTLPSEAPPGHVPLRGLALHALWDSWIHERDIALPLGLTPAEEPDEVGLALEYVAALGPAFVSTYGEDPSGCVVIEGTDPEICLVVTMDETVEVGRPEGPVPEGAGHLRGPTLGLVEGLSYRAPFPTDISPDAVAMFSGLALAFDQA